MTITKEIPAEQIKGLGLHQGDSLRVVAENGSTFLIQIERGAADVPVKGGRGNAGAWARQYSGAAKPEIGETTEDIRVAHHKEKYGT